MTARILRRATGCVAAVSGALLAAGIALSYADRHMGSLSRWNFSDVFEEATFIAVPVVGVILTSRRPGNRGGWIFLGTGLVVGLGFFCDRYGRGGLVAAPGSLPAARVAAWFANSAWTTIPAAGLAFILLLFPAGRLRSRRWRPAAWFVAAAFTLYTAAEVVRAGHVWADPYTALSSGWYPGSHTAGRPGHRPRGPGPRRAGGAGTRPRLGLGQPARMRSASVADADAELAGGAVVFHVV